MTETLTVELHNRQQAWAAIKAQVFPFLAQVLQGGKRWECWATPEQIKLLKDDLLFYRLHCGKVKGSSVQARHK